MKTELLKYMNNGDCYRLAGPRNSTARQEVMRIITGIKLPKARCGVNAIQRGLFEVADIPHNHLAGMEKDLTSWLQS